jgi:hypothetical protein
MQLDSRPPPPSQHNARCSCHYAQKSPAAMRRAHNPADVPETFWRLHRAAHRATPPTASPHTSCASLAAAFRVSSRFRHLHINSWRKSPAAAGCRIMARLPSAPRTSSPAGRTSAAGRPVDHLPPVAVAARSIQLSALTTARLFPTGHILSRLSQCGLQRSVSPVMSAFAVHWPTPDRHRCPLPDQFAVPRRSARVRTARGQESPTHALTQGEPAGTAAGTDWVRTMVQIDESLRRFLVRSSSGCPCTELHADVNTKSWRTNALFKKPALCHHLKPAPDTPRRLPIT